MPLTAERIQELGDAMLADEPGATRAAAREIVAEHATEQEVMALFAHAEWARGMTVSLQFLIKMRGLKDFTDADDLAFADEPDQES